MTVLNDRRARAETIALNARQIELAILRLMRRLEAGEVRSNGLADSRKTFAGLAARYEAAAQRGREQRRENGPSERPSERSRPPVSRTGMSRVGKAAPHASLTP